MISYSWQTVVAPFFANDQITTGSQSTPAVSALAGGRYFAAWYDPTNTQIEGRVIGPDGSGIGNEFVVNTTTASFQLDPAVGG